MTTTGEGSGVRPLQSADLLELGRWNTPTIYNGWEQITAGDASRDAFNLEETTDFMPQMGPMVGYAVTLVCQPGERSHREANPAAWSEYRRYIAGIPGPKIVVVQDLDKPNHVGSFWGEVNASVHRALGCVGAIVDGCIRDVDEMTAAGFKAIARRLCVGHAWSWPVAWGGPVEVFGRRIEPGQLIHADKHGFLAVPFGEEPRLLEAARFMDTNECRTVIEAAKESAGKSPEEIVRSLDEASARFRKNIQDFFNRQGEF
ncbi:MAG: RraA family protein [Blastocatellales bacterium]